MVRISLRHIIFTLLTGIFIHCSHSGDRVPLVNPDQKLDNPKDSIFIEQFEQTIREELLPSTPGMAVAVVKAGHILLNQGYGVKVIDKSDPVTPLTLFRIGSLSKGVAAVSAALLAEEQKLDWDQSLKNYLNDFNIKDTTKSDSILIKHILSHTSGFAYHTYTNLIEAGLPIATILNNFNKVHLIAIPGTQYSYQNAAFSLYQLVVEKITGKPYPEYLKQSLFLPWNMCQTGAHYMDMRKSENFAIPHRYREGAWNQSSLNSKYYNAVPAGGIHASITDMSHYMNQIIELLHRDPDHKIQEIFKPQIKTPVEWRYFSHWSQVDSASYGMGWRIVHQGSDDVYYHGGLVNNYRSEIAIFPKERMGVCFLYNSAPQNAKKSIPAFQKVYNKIFSSP